MAFIGAALGVLSLAVTWYAAHEVARLRRVDVNILLGFMQLNRHRQLEWIPQTFIWLCDPSHYVVLAAVPIAIALVRGRRRVAVAALALLLGANGTTELLKPLAAGPRDQVAAPWVVLSHTTWPSGHATASMSLALALIICVPGRLRPAVSALTALFVLGVVYSLLALGAHYPSDLLGGFEVASTWTLLALGGLWTYEAHRPALATRLADAGTRFSVGEALLPSAAMLVGALGLGGVLVALHPHQVIGYAGSHTAFVTGAIVLAVLSFACAAGLSLVLRRPPAPPVGSGQAPTAAPGSRPGRRARSLLG
jgi:membrane-associated phospholipid phosphatase